MRNWLRDAPIRQKLMALGVIASICALAVASLVFLASTYVVARGVTHDNVVAQASITADNVSAALAFQDHAAANDTLRTLHATPSIDAACLWDDRGLFAAYQTSPSLSCPRAAPADADRVEANRIEIALPVTVDNRRVGSLYIRANLHEVKTRLQLQALATAVALLLGTAAALLFAGTFQRVIAKPIATLSATASDISRRGDYAIRADGGGRDETGQLIAAFNEMLHQIQRRDEELRMANRLKDEFLATLSHELRTPLNAILGWLQILQVAPPSEERMKQALEILERNAKAQARLVDDLLDVSRIVAGKLRLKLGLVDVRSVVDAAIDSVRLAADAKGVHIETRFEKPPHVVKGDPDRLQQAAWNLLANAVKFSEPGGSIHVSLGRASDRALIAVEDTGAGIDQAFLPHIFEPFRQADASMTRRHPGLGLGLAIVKEIADAHGGHIEAFSAGSGKGARFALLLPLARRQHVDDQPAKGTPGSETVLRGLTALVVDDDDDAREVAAMALAARGAHVATARDATTAMELLAQRNVDVLIADLAMPDVDGYGLLARLKSMVAATGRAIPAVALTAQASADDESRATGAGFVAFIRKPYRFDDLVDAVETAARGARTT